MTVEMTMELAVARKLGHKKNALGKNVHLFDDNCGYRFMTDAILVWWNFGWKLKLETLLPGSGPQPRQLAQPTIHPALTRLAKSRPCSLLRRRNGPAGLWSSPTLRLQAWQSSSRSPSVDPRSMAAVNPAGVTSTRCAEVPGNFQLLSGSYDLRYDNE